MLLELLSRLPDLDPRARPDRGPHAPRRAAHLEQLARADRGAQAPLPVPVARLPDARARARDRPPARARAAASTVARRLVEVVAHGARARPQEAALDRRVDRLGARAAAARRRGHRPGDLPRHDVDHRQAPHRPRHGGRARRRAARRDRRDRSTRGILHLGSPTRCAPRAWRSGPPSSTTRSPRSARSTWTRARAVPRGAGGHAGQVARGPARLRPRLRALLLPRHRGRRRCEHGVREGDAERRRHHRRRADRLRRAARADPARRSAAGDEAALRDLARLAIAAFGRRGEGSGVLGVDVQRIRRALGLRSEPGGPVQERRLAGRAAPHARADPRASRPTCGASSSARRSSARRRCRRRGR